MLIVLVLFIVIGSSTAQFFMPWYLNETKELMDLDIAIVKGMNKPYSKHQIAQVIHDTYEFYSKLEDVCYMIESYDDTGFRIYDEFMHKDQVGLLKIGPHCTAVEFNETVLIEKYNWTQQNATELLMNVRGILYSWYKLQQLRETFIITTTTTTTTTTVEPPTTRNRTRSRKKSVNRGNKTKVTKGPHSTGKTRGTYKKRTKKISTVKTITTENILKFTVQNSTT